MSSAIVLGGGITGLTAAHQLKQRGIAVTLLERSARIGGWIRTLREQAYHFELGPRSCRSEGSGQATLQLAKQLGICDQIIWADSAAKRRFLYTGGKLRPISLLRGPRIVHLWRKLWQERKVPPTACEDESIYEFFCRRLSPCIANLYVAAITTGIYAGDTHQLSVRACFPRLWELEKRYGSLVRGLSQERKKGSLFSFINGMETLPKALADQLGTEIILNANITSLSLGPDRVVVQCPDRTFEASHLFSAIPADQLAALLPELGPWHSPPTASIGIVNLVYDQDVLPQLGFGYLVPPIEKESILGAVWDSCIFPKQHAAGTTLTVMLGGVQQPELLKSPPQVLLEIAKTALAQHLRIDLEPTHHAITIANQAIPQYPVGYPQTMADLRKRLDPYPISLLGSNFTGVSINDCIEAATRAVATHCAQG